MGQHEQIIFEEHKIYLSGIIWWPNIRWYIHCTHKVSVEILLITLVWDETERVHVKQKTFDLAFLNELSKFPESV